MFRKLSYVLLFTSLLCACDPAPRFKAEGTIDGAADSMIYLDALSLDGTKVVDSARVSSDGSFSLKASAPTDAPEFFALRIGSHRITFSVDSTETISFTANVATMDSKYTVKGSESCEKIREITLLQQDLQKKLIAVETNRTLYPGDIIDSINALVLNYKEYIKQNYIFTAPSSASAYYAVCQSITDARGTFLLYNPSTDREDVKCYAAVATAWDAFYPDAARTQQICNAAIQGLGNTAPPQTPAPAATIPSDKIKESGIIDISLPDIDSHIRSISELKGKVVLLDFTVYGAKESAQRTRTMRTLYDRYHAQGLEIYQISVDEDIHFWKQSVEHLPWICVHETDGAATSTYNVQAVPTFFLINRDNEVVVRSQFMQGTLEENLLKLL